MTDRFDGVWLKLGRARQHIDNLETAIVAFHDTGPYQIVTVDDPQTGKRIAKIGSAPAPIPDEVPLTLGDAVHAIRASVDHFLYAAVPNPTPETAFPVSRRGVPTAAYWKSLIGGKAKGVSKPLMQALLTLEAYEGGADNYLWLVDRLDLVDKHRLVLTTGVAYSAMTFDFGAFFRGRTEWAKEVPELPISLRPAERYPVQEGTEFFVADPEVFEMHADLKFTFDVAFGEPQALAGEPVAATLRKLLGDVEGLLKPPDPSGLTQSSWRGGEGRSHHQNLWTLRRVARNRPHLHP